MEKKKGTFKEGHIPWNKDLKGIHLSPTTEYKEGQTAGEKSNMWKGGVQHNAKDVVYLYDGVGKRIRRPKKVYEDAGNVVPKGWVVYHLDKVMTNDKIENLIAVPRAILVKLNRDLIASDCDEIKKEIEIYLNEKTTL
jgi:hypothetical protein